MSKSATKKQQGNNSSGALGRWATLIGGAALAVITLLVIGAVLARWFFGTETGAQFLADYDGTAPMPDTVPVGIPAWLNWAHFFNMFLMALIIRSGIQVRREQRVRAFWSPAWNPGRKIPLTLWFHQSLDLLWVINGIVFFILLFATGQWMRIVPTSWEVFPNAVSAGLQYLSLDWPSENGWVYYNALQQLAYFVTVFIAAPLAIASGVRMSGLWPRNNQALSKAFPAPLARAIHFPVMIYFVVFIIIHVVLVFATGALRNLNHMFAARGDTDPAAYAGDWTGFIIFVIAAAITAAAWCAARPLLLAPLARLCGKVTMR